MTNVIAVAIRCAHGKSSRKNIFFHKMAKPFFGTAVSPGQQAFHGARLLSAYLALPDGNGIIEGIMRAAGNFWLGRTVTS
jgi:hypothetical protein